MLLLVCRGLIDPTSNPKVHSVISLEDLGMDVLVVGRIEMSVIG
jgi:hypothetical protein